MFPSVNTIERKLRVNRDVALKVGRVPVRLCVGVDVPAGWGWCTQLGASRPDAPWTC